MSKSNWKISLDVNQNQRVTGLRPVMQKCLNFFTDGLPSQSPIVKTKFIDVYEKTRTTLDQCPKFDQITSESFANRTALYVLWRDILNHHVASSYSLSDSFKRLGERCPPFGVSMRLDGIPVPFQAKYTCKHFFCPHCRLRKNLALWNRVNNEIEFKDEVPLTLVQLEANVTQEYHSVGSGLDLRVPKLKQLSALVAQSCWRYQGAWTVSILSELNRLNTKLKLGLVCPQMPGKFYQRIKAEVHNFNLEHALEDSQCSAKVKVFPVVADSTTRENLFSEVIPSGIWPSSFMVDYKDPISSAFALDIGPQVSNLRSLGYIGPCNTVKKRLAK